MKPTSGRVNPFMANKAGFYSCPFDITYYSPRYRLVKSVPLGFLSDGASGPAEDIYSEGWWVHDKLYRDGTWDDGTICTRFEADVVLYDILVSEGRWFRARSWWIFVRLFGWRRYNPAISRSRLNVK